LNGRQAARSGSSETLRALIVAAALLLLTGLPVWAQQPTGAAGRSTTAASGRVMALGRIEPTGGLVQLGTAPGRRIEAIGVEEGADLPAGAEVAQIEGRSQAQAALALAEANRALALDQRARQREARAIERAREDRLQKPRLDALQSAHDTLNGRLTTYRAAIIGVAPTLPPRDRADAELGLDRLAIQVSEAAVKLEEAKADSDLLTRKRALEDREMADDAPEVKLLDAQVAQAQAALDETAVRTPSAGRVLRVLAHPGEVSTGTIAVLGDLSRLVVRAEVDEAVADRVKVGDAATITVRGQAVSGQVSRIGQIVGFNRLQDLDPRAPRDLRVMPVTVTLDPQSAAAAHVADFVNLQVDVAIGGAAPAADGAR
jgi:ABC exporter DevB family membrane fusion protein